VLGHPDAGEVQVPELVGPLDAEEPGPAPTRQPAAALDQPAHAQHAQHALAVDRSAQPPAHPRRDDAVAVGRVLHRNVDDRRLDLVRRRPSTIAASTSSAGGRAGAAGAQGDDLVQRASPLASRPLLRVRTLSLGRAGEDAGTDGKGP